MNVTLWLVWVVANAIGGAAGGAAVDVWGWTGALAFGILMSAAQTTVLRLRLREAVSWMIISGIAGLLGWFVAVIGGYLGYLIGQAVLITISGAWHALFGITLDVPDIASPGPLPFEVFRFGVAASIGGLAVGAVVGLAQGFALVLPGGFSGLWVRACALGGWIGAVVAGPDLVRRLISAHPDPAFLTFPDGAAAGAVFGLLFGAVTGLTLVQLLRYRTNGTT